MNNYEEAFAPVIARNKAIVTAQTFGHLAPERYRGYKGWIVFCLGEYGDIVPIACNFEDLPDSPWFFDDMTEFIGDEVEKVEEGTVHRFDGTYTKFKNGKYRFSGTIRQINTR